MNFIKAMIRDYKINKGLIPLKTVTLDTGIVLQHFVIRDSTSKTRTIKIIIKK